jgi:hypothetical protein
MRIESNTFPAPLYEPISKGLLEQGVEQNRVGSTSAEVTTAVRQFVLEADLMAYKILNPNSSAVQDPVVVHHHHYSYWPYFPIWWEPTTFVVLSDRPVRDSRDSTAFFILGLTAAIIAGVGLFVTGKSLGRYKETTAHLENAVAIKQQLSFYDIEENGNIVEEVKNIADLQERICNRLRSSLMTDLLLRISLTAAAALTFVGTTFILAGFSPLLSSSLITTSLVIGLAATVGMLFKGGFDNTSQHVTRDAHFLRTLFSKFDESYKISIASP